MNETTTRSESPKPLAGDQRLPTTHTPGPWSLSKNGDRAGLSVTLYGPNKSQALGKIHTGSFEYIANARLIYAAPDLLDAAKFAWAAMNSEAGRARASEALLAAIAKATISVDGSPVQSDQQSPTGVVP